MYVFLQFWSANNRSAVSLKYRTVDIKATVANEVLELRTQIIIMALTRSKSRNFRMTLAWDTIMRLKSTVRQFSAASAQRIFNFL